jgi:hypothetical protein
LLCDQSKRLRSIMQKQTQMHYIKPIEQNMVKKNLQ